MNHLDFKLNQKNCTDKALNESLVNENSNRFNDVKHMKLSEVKSIPMMKQLRSLVPSKKGGDEKEIISAYDEQSRKYKMWKENGQVLKNILISRDEEAIKLECKHHLNFADEYVYTFNRIEENCIFQFWHCDDENKLEFLLYQYALKKCDLHSIVQDLSHIFSVGLNIRRNCNDQYAVVIHAGVPNEVNLSVQKQLQQDFDFLHAQEKPRVRTAIYYLGQTFNQALDICCKRTLEKIKLWEGSSFTFRLPVRNLILASFSVVGMTFLLYLVLMAQIRQVAQFDALQVKVESTNNFESKSNVYESINSINTETASPLLPLEKLNKKAAHSGKRFKSSSNPKDYVEPSNKSNIAQSLGCFDENISAPKDQIYGQVEYPYDITDPLPKNWDALEPENQSVLEKPKECIEQK